MTDEYETYIEYRVEWRRRPSAPWRPWGFANPSKLAVEDKCEKAQSRHSAHDFRVASRIVTVTRTDWTPTEKVSP